MINQNSLEQFIHDPETGTLSAKYLFLSGLQDLLTAVNAILLADVFQGPARPGITGRFIRAFANPTAGGLRDVAFWLSREHAGPATRALMDFIQADNKNGWVKTMVELRNQWAHPREDQPEAVLAKADMKMEQMPDFSVLGKFAFSANSDAVWIANGSRLDLSPFFWVETDCLVMFTAVKDSSILVRQDRQAPTQERFQALWQTIRRTDSALANADIDDVHDRMAQKKPPCTTSAPPPPWWLEKVFKKGAIGLLTLPELLDGIAAHVLSIRPGAGLLELSMTAGTSPAEKMALELGLFQPPDIETVVSWITPDRPMILILRADDIHSRDLEHIIKWLADLCDANVKDQVRVFIGRSARQLEQDFIYLEDRMPDAVDQLLRYPPGIRPRTLKDCLWHQDQKKAVIKEVWHGFVG